MSKPYNPPEPEGYFEIGIIDIDCLASGNKTIDEIYDGPETVKKRIQFMAYELMRARGFAKGDEQEPLTLSVNIDTDFPDREMLAGVMGQDLGFRLNAMFNREFAEESITFSFKNFKSKTKNKEFPSKEELLKVFQPELVEFLLANNPRQNPECMDEGSVMAQVLEVAEENPKD